MSEIRHFTKEEGTESAYGYTFHQIVLEYLKKGYEDENNQCDLTVLGVNYKALRRNGVTAFYDENGNTLFDVTEDRLADEYEWYSANMEVATEPQSEIGKAIAGIEKAAFDGVVERTNEADNMVYMGKSSLADVVTGNIPKPTEEELAEAEEKYGTLEEAFTEELEDEVECDEQTDIVENKDSEEIAGNEPQEISEEDNQEKGENGEETKETSGTSVYIGIVGATTKLQEELKKAKNKSFAEPIIEYLVERCKESESLANDICQDHKTWEKCYNYIYEQARKELKGNSGAVRDNVVFEWAEDYFHRDDKAEEEKKAKAEAEKKKKAAEAKKAAPVKKENKARADYDTTRKSSSDNHKLSKAEIAEMDAKKQEKPKKSSKDMDGQMDFFSMMGM